MGAYGVQSINRNIVECKVKMWIFTLKYPICINRNIVECKDKAETEKTDEQRCINRNIVECKVRTSSDMLSHIRVLIET